MPGALGELLLAIEKTKHGRVDLGGLAPGAVQDAVHALDGLYRFKRGVGFVPNSVAQGALTAPEAEVVSGLRRHLDSAIASGRASFARLPNGRVNVVEGTIALPPLGPIQWKPPSQSGGGDLGTSKYPIVADGDATETHWWGLSIHISHENCQALVLGGAAAAALAAALGAPAWVAPAIAATIAVLKAFDQGNGIFLDVPWAFPLTGVWWISTA